MLVSENFFTSITREVRFEYSRIGSEVSHPCITECVETDGLIICWEGICGIPQDVILVLAGLKPFCPSAHSGRKDKLT